MLALICGQGALPGLIVRNLSHAPVIAALEQFPPEGLAVDLTFRLETLGTFLKALKKRGVLQVCFAGAIRRPKIDPEQIDAATQPLVAQISGALSGGDDAALRAVVDIFEQAGFEVVGFTHLVPELLPRGGVLSIRQPMGTRATRCGAGSFSDCGTLSFGYGAGLRGGFWSCAGR